MTRTRPAVIVEESPESDRRPVSPKRCRRRTIVRFLTSLFLGVCITLVVAWLPLLLRPITTALGEPAVDKPRELAGIVDPFFRDRATWPHQTQTWMVLPPRKGEAGSYVDRDETSIAAFLATSELGRHSPDPDSFAQWVRGCRSSADPDQISRGWPSHRYRIVVLRLTDAGWPLRTVTCWQLGDQFLGPTPPTVEGGVFFSGTTNWAFGRWLNDPIVLPVRPIWSGLIVNSLLYGSITFALLAAYRAVLRRLRLGRNRCPECAYSRLGLQTSDACPECGTVGSQ